jgi:hypothetical protein
MYTYTLPHLQQHLQQPTALAAAILSMDTGTVSVDALLKLRGASFEGKTKEEDQRKGAETLAVLQAYTGDIAQLGETEQVRNCC